MMGGLLQWLGQQQPMPNFGAQAQGGRPMGVPATPPPAGSQWQDPALRGRAMQYDALLQRARTDPSYFASPVRHQMLVRAAAAVGRTPEQMQSDLNPPPHEGILGGGLWNQRPGSVLPTTPLAPGNAPQGAPRY